MLLLNDDDLTYAKLRLDERSMATVVQHIAGFDSSLARALCWAAAWDMVRDAELAARDYVALVCTGLPAERDINLATATLRQAPAALTMYADPEWAPTGWAAARRHRPQPRWPRPSRAAASSSPGPGRYVGAARADEDLAVLRGWLAGDGVPGRPDRRHRAALVAAAGAGRRWARPAEPEIDARAGRRPHGQRRAGGRAGPGADADGGEQGRGSGRG